MPNEIIKAFAYLKKAAAITNNNLGYIDIKSKLGKGSEFLITLPSSMS